MLNIVVRNVEVGGFFEGGMGRRWRGLRRSERHVIEGSSERFSWCGGDEGDIRVGSSGGTVARHGENSMRGD